MSTYKFQHIGFLSILLLILCLANGCDDQTSGSTKVTPKPTVDEENTCKGDLELCGTECVDIRADIRHCGGCDKSVSEGEICEDGEIVSCGSLTVCGAKCIDTQNDPENCSRCGLKCHDSTFCQAGQCVCNNGLYDCDGNSPGCESISPCSCEPGSSGECYPIDTSDLVIGGSTSSCRLGQRTCDSSGQWSLCKDFILPVADDGDLQNDSNCNGVIDANEDMDKDGVTKGQGDCCDDSESCKAGQAGNIKITTPELINPNRREIQGDNVDNNCNGQVDEENEEVTCSAEESKYFDAQFPSSLGGENAGAALALARAMDVCDPIVSESSGKPGIISVSVDASTGKLPDIKQLNALSYMSKTTKESAGIHPQKGPSMALLSSGLAVDGSKREKNYGNKKFNRNCKIPAAYAAIHGDKLESNKACGNQPSKNQINDVAALHLRMRAPSDAKGFKFKFRFFSLEYPYWVCSKYNDFFLALLDSKHTPDLPADHNISFDKMNNPVSVNNAFFTSCQNFNCKTNKDKEKCQKMKIMSCQSGGEQLCQRNDGSDACPDGDVGEKAVESIYPVDKDKYGQFHGGTAWLVSSAGIKGGEVFDLDFYIWDTGEVSNTGGDIYDSTVIIDGFEWTYVETEIGTEIITNPIN